MTMPTKAQKRTPSAYDEQTPEKIAFGKRMKEAREIAGLSQAEAAEAMGYSQAVQLSLMESGQRMPPARVLIACAVLYGTTMDYLCGLVEDSDRDPALGLQRHLGAMLEARAKAFMASMTTLTVDVVRDVMPTMSECVRLAETALESAAALESFRARNPKFDDMRGGATLAAKIELNKEVAMHFGATIERAKRITATRTMREARDNVSGTRHQVEQMSLLPALDLLKL